MPLSETLLNEFDHEMKVTRTMLERVPLENGPWKPHTKSRGIGALASHIAYIPGLGGRIASSSEYDATSPDASKPRGEFTTTEALLAEFDTNVAFARDAIAKLSDADFMAPWSFKRGGQVMLSGARAQMLRSMLMNHLIHHRGQLSVYLRLNDVPLPPVYGPTADS
jgi:DinB family.